MAKPAEKLAESLKALRAIQERGTVAIRSGDLTRTHRERLLRNGFLQKVIKGWYVPTRPDETSGESTAWYASFWKFCAAYLCYLKGERWCLSPEQSLSLHAGNRAVPKQLLVRAFSARNNVTTLPHGTSLLVIRAAMPSNGEIEEKDGLRIYSIPAALIACSPEYFKHHRIDARAVLSQVHDASQLLDRLLKAGHTTIAGRLAGAFRNMGKERIADDILKAMHAAGYKVRESDPFETRIAPIRVARKESPYAYRIRLMWDAMRGKVLEGFPQAPGLPQDTAVYLKHVEAIYVADAYHSLSIEGYRVSTELIERVRSGTWNPDGNDDDRDHRNALAARGYWQAHQAVLESTAKVLGGANAGEVADADHGDWYRQMFAPGVTAGLLQPADLAGYRNGSVYIRRSMHVPPDGEAMRDAMPVFFDLLRNEEEPAVRVVLGHFIFVYIHPYMDGNGRIGRFLMNVMLASGGYPWTVVPLNRRDSYMAALERASVEQDIGSFADFLAELVDSEIK